MRTVLARLHSLPERFTLLARTGLDNVVTHAPAPLAPCATPDCSCHLRSDLWLTKVRSGLTPEARRRASWTTSTFFPVDTILNSFASSSPEKRFGFSFRDVTELLVMDATGSGSWDEFAEEVASIVISARLDDGSEDFTRLLREERRLAVERGEMGILPRVVGPMSIRMDGEGRYNSQFEERFVARIMFKEIR